MLKLFVNADLEISYDNNLEINNGKGDLDFIIEKLTLKLTMENSWKESILHKLKIRSELMDFVYQTTKDICIYM